MLFEQLIWGKYEHWRKIESNTNLLIFEVYAFYNDAMIINNIIMLHN